MSICVRGAMPNFRNTPEQVERQKQVRSRDIAALRFVLNGGTHFDFGKQQDISADRIRIGVMKVAHALYYRAQDRTGITRIPRGIPDLQKNAVLWLKKLDENEALLYELDPAKLAK